MRERLEGLLERYGQKALLTRREGGDAIALRAFVQPLLRQKEELPLTPTPLGAASGQRWLYIGSGRQPIAPGDQLDCGGLRLVAQESCPVRWQEEVFYWRAVLRPRREAAV